jgi:hypothetical protein
LNAATRPPQPSFLRRHGWKLVLSALITVFFVRGLTASGMQIIPSASAFDHVRWWAVPAYLATLVGMSVYRAIRWRYLLRQIAIVPKTRLLAVSWIGFAAILLLPFRLGELARPYMLHTRGTKDPSGKPVGAITMSAATGSVVAERVVDGLFLSIVLAIALLTVPHIVPLPDTVVGLPVPVERVRQAGFMMVGVFATALIVIAVYYVARDFARRATLAVFGLVSKKLGEKLAGMASNLADGFHFFGRARDAIGFLWETTVYWGLNVFGMWILALGCGVVHANGTGITFGESCAVMGMLGITILVPGPPGLLGPFQLGIYAGMTMYFPTSVVVGPGAAYVFLLYVVQFGWSVGSAAFFLVFGDKSNWHKLEEAEGIVPPSEDDEPSDPPAEKLAQSAAER